MLYLMLTDLNKLVYILFILTACGTQSTEKHKNNSFDATSSSKSSISKVVIEAAQTVSKPENSFVDKSQFKVAKQSSFSLVNWYYGARQKKLVVMTADEVKKYFQDSNLKNNLDNNYGNYYFFSVQKTFPTIVVTLIEEYDVCCADLLLMRYDSSNRLISKEKVAGTGGDGGWGYNEYGKFVSDSIYQLIRVDQETAMDEQDTIRLRIDSVVTQFQMSKDYRFAQKDKQAFERIQVLVD